MRKFILHAFLCCITALLLIISVLRRGYNGIKSVKFGIIGGLIASKYRILPFILSG